MRFLGITAIAASIVLLLIGACAATYVPRLQIQEIVISGAQKTSPQGVKSYVEAVINDGKRHIVSRSNVFLYPKQTIEKVVVEQFPRIKQVLVMRDGPFEQTLYVRIEERQPAYVWCGQQCYYMDKEGFLFEEAPNHDSSMYVFSGGRIASSSPIGEKFLQSYLAEVVAILDILKKDGRDPEGAEVVDEHDYVIKLQGGPRLLVAFGAEADSVARNFKTVVDSEMLRNSYTDIEHIDLRYGNRVFYKMKGGAEEPAPTSANE